MPTSNVPTLYEWMGGLATIERLMKRFYERVPEDAVLAPVFAHMDPQHAAHVAAFIAEVFGGPKAYSEQHGGHAHMIRKHLGRALDEVKRRRWIALLLDCADELQLKDDPEFRSAFVAYLEWARAWPCSTHSPARKRSRTRRCRSGAGAKSKVPTWAERDARSSSAGEPGDRRDLVAASIVPWCSIV